MELLGVIRFLEARGPTLREVAEVLESTVGQVHARVKRLRKAGLIARSEGYRSLRLTEAGRAFL